MRGEARATLRIDGCFIPCQGQLDGECTASALDTFYVHITIVKQYDFFHDGEPNAHSATIVHFSIVGAIKACEQVRYCRCQEAQARDLFR